MSRKSEQHLPAGLVEHQDRPVYFHDSPQIAHEHVDAARGRRAGERECQAGGVIRSMGLLVAAELEGHADRRDDGRRRDRSGGTQRPPRLRPNASSFGAFLKGVVRERERADDELRRAADKQLARIEFGE